MENIEKLKEKLDKVYYYLYVQTLGKVGEDALFELDDALNIVKNLLIQRVSESKEIRDCHRCEFDDKIGICPRCDTDAYSR